MNMTIDDHQELIQLLVTNLDNHNLFLGYDWLQKHNLSIDWEKVDKDKDIKEKTIEKGEKVLFINLEKEVWRREELNIWSKSKSIEEIERDIPKEYKDVMTWQID